MGYHFVSFAFTFPAPPLSETTGCFGSSKAAGPAVYPLLKSWPLRDLAAHAFSSKHSVMGPNHSHSFSDIPRQSDPCLLFSPCSLLLGFLILS